MPADAPISCSWQCHKDRNPPSSEPGTDIACAYGTVIWAPYPGTVIEIKTSNSGGMGRFVALQLDDGRTTRAIHMSAVFVGVGQRVDKWTHLGLSGASGYGSDWYYGPHVHQTLWPGCYWCDATIDFMLYVGPDPEPEPEPTPRRKWEETMVYAAYRDDNGTIAIQHYPRGRIMQLGDPNEWAAIHAATGAGYHQVSNQYLADKMAWYGQAPFPDMEHSTGMVVLVDQGTQQRYLLAGGALVQLVDENTIGQIDGRVPSLWISSEEIANIQRQVNGEESEQRK